MGVNQINSSLFVSHSSLLFFRSLFLSLSFSSRPLRGRAAARDGVFVQQRHAAEGARAGAALVLLHLRVRLQVGAQVGAIGECPVTVGTGEWALTCEKKRGGKKNRFS